MIATKAYVGSQTIPLQYEIDKIKEELHKDRRITNPNNGEIITVKCLQTRIYDLEETMKALLRYLEVFATDTPVIPSRRTIEPYRDKK